MSEGRDALPQVARDGAAAEFVAVSELEVDPAGIDDLEHAFANRLGAVEGWPEFIRLEVWADASTPGRYVMVSWWRSKDGFTEWMRSSDHDRSHARMPTAHLPKPRSFRRYRLVAR